jgi:hypothetical protein
VSGAGGAATPGTPKSLFDARVACPTLTAAADDTPSGTMKVTLATFKAT